MLFIFDKQINHAGYLYFKTMLRHIHYHNHNNQRREKKGKRSKEILGEDYCYFISSDRYKDQNRTSGARSKLSHL